MAKSNEVSLQDQKHLADYVQQRNRLSVFYKGKTYSEKNLTAEDRKTLLDHLEGDLSPENLSCDGELRGAKLKAKTAMLKGAQNALIALSNGATYQR